jgi:ATP-binding cassette subfamily B protein
MSNSLQPEDNVAVELTFKKLFWKLWPFLSRHKQNIAIALALVIGYAIVGRALPFLFGTAVDEGIRKHDNEIIVKLALGYFVVEILRATFAFLQTSYIQRFGNQVLFEIREELISHVQKLPLYYFDKTASGRIMTRVTNDVFALGELFSQGFASIFICLIEMATIFGALLFVSWKLTAMTIIVLPLLIWACRRLSLIIRFEFGAAKRKLSMINGFSAESIAGMKVLQLFHRQQEACSGFDKLSSEYRIQQLRTVRLFALLWPLIEAFNLFALASSLLLGSFFAKEVGLSVGEMSAFLLLLQSFFKPFKVILERYNQLQNSLASADRVFQILDETEESQTGNKILTETQGAIEFRNVSFRYQSKGPLVLDGISVQIQPGTSVALVGRTGSGKSTMIALLQRMYELKSGEIILDGENIKTAALVELRKRIGVVQQDGFIFSGSLLSNITLDDPMISRARASWAAEQAQCADLLRRHGGMDAPVQERGANLSVGERQLIAFARALAFDPEILILDEATANIDSVNEERIQVALKNVTKNRTSLIIAHRLSTVLGCDQILLLDQGRLLQNGKHRDLIEMPGPYQELCRSHFGSPSTLI